MTYSYFSGCTLKNKQRSGSLCQRVRKSSGIWTGRNWKLAVLRSCITNSDEIATKLSSVRALADAKERTGSDHSLVPPVIHDQTRKRWHGECRRHSDKVNNYMALSSHILAKRVPLSGSAAWRRWIWQDQRESGKPIKGRKIRHITAVCCFVRAPQCSLTIRKIRQSLKTLSGPWRNRYPMKWVLRRLHILKERKWHPTW